MSKLIASLFAATLALSAFAVHADDMKKEDSAMEKKEEKKEHKMKSHHKKAEKKEEMKEEKKEDKKEDMKK